MAIPANSRDKDLSWSFIKAVCSKAMTLGMARNGNGPVRISTYADPTFSASQPLAAIELEVLAKARPAFPPFPEAVRAQSILLEEVQLAVLGRKSPEEAVKAIARDGCSRFCRPDTSVVPAYYWVQASVALNWIR